MDLTTVLSVIVVLVLIVWWKSTCRPAGLPPSPGYALPVIGHFYLLDKDPRVQLRAWRKQYGDIFSLYMGSNLMIVLNGYEVIKEALVKHADAFSDRPRVSMFELVTQAKGVGDTSGPLWKAQRKITVEILRHFGLGKNLLARKVREEVGEFIKALSAKSSQTFDLSRLVQVSVSNNICSIAFGKRFDYDDQHFLKLVESMEEMFKLAGGASVITFLPILRYIPGDLFKIQKAIDYYSHIVDTFLIPAIDQHVKDYQEGLQDDFISAYLQAAKEAPEKGIDQYVNEYNLQKVLMDVFAAGTDTTATTIRWAVIYFLHHPEVQEKCYQDVVNVTGTDRAPKIEDRAEMTYMEATVMEVLRISEIAPLGVMHFSAFEEQFRGYTIPKGAFIMPNLDSVLHDPGVWKEPEKFSPERFIDADGKLVRREELLAFSIGRRVCPGESLARMELFLYLSTMVQRFRFLPPEDGQLPPLVGTIGLVHDPKPFQVRTVPRN